MRKLYLLFVLCIVMLGSCRTAKPIERIEKTDSTTTIIQRQVPVIITADSVKGVEKLDIFTEAFKKAKHGQVFLTKKSKRVTYSVIKDNDSDFTISAHTAQVDTSVVSNDTITKVNRSVVVVKEKQANGIMKLWLGFKNYILFSLLLLIIILYLSRRNR